MRYLPLLLCFLAGLTGCGDCAKEQVPEVIRLEGQLRILMHEQGRYTIFEEMPNGLVRQHSFEICRDHKDPVITHGLPVKQPTWVEYQREQGGCNRLIAIHLHSVSEINGAGWNHGKFGRGQTTVIE
jgi:hypothetical protein